MDIFLTREVRGILEEEAPILDAIRNSESTSSTTVLWGPTYFDQRDLVQKTIMQNANDRYILVNRWAYGYRLDPQNPTQITWLDVDDSRLKLGYVLEGTPNQTTFQVLCKYTVDDVDYLPVGCTCFSQDEYVESVRLS